MTDISVGNDIHSLQDVGFHPDRPVFAVTCIESNQVRVYDAVSLGLMRTYENPEAQFDRPHGIVFADRHFIVSNKHDPMNRPSQLNVYRLDDPSGAPVTVFRTPISSLREAHSLTLKGNKLLVSYCGANIGAILSYKFDDETGLITGPIDKHESWFVGRGEPKGIEFNAQGTRAVVTVVTEKRSRLSDRVRRARVLLQNKEGVRRLLYNLSRKPGKWFKTRTRRAAADGESVNGLLVYAVDERGMFSLQPEQNLLEERFCRLENVSIASNICAVADPINNRVDLYSYDGDWFPDQPIQSLTDGFTFPHDACISPDKKQLLVINNGLQVIDDRPQWFSYSGPGSDRISVYELRD